MTKTNSTHKKSNILKLAVAALLMTLGLQNAVAQQSSEISADVKSLLEFYEKQIYFTENKGQWSSDIHYRAEFPLGQALATSEGMLVGTYDPAGISARFDQGMREEEAIRQGGFFNEPKVKVKGHGWMLKFVNSSPSMTIESKSKHKDVFNYFSSEASKSKTDAANYQEVWYHNVYTNVDVRYYPSAEGSLEYDMICKPGFNKDNIVLQFDGISKVTKQSDGSLVLETSVGDMTLPAPVAYQKVKGEKKSVTSQYTVTDNNTVKFEIGAFDAAQTLIIDPIALRWATWINSGSSGDNHGHCIWVDPADGAIYVVARVVGTTNNITTGAFDESANGNLETIIGKYLEPSTIGGSGTRVWQTYIGGSGDDNPYAMEQGPDGNLYVTGYTTSTNFPLLGGTAFSGSSIDQRAQAGQNIFIMKINKTGTSIKSSVIGGGGSEGSYDLRINSAGDVVICGNTSSTNLATLYSGSGASNSNNGNSDVLLFKINQNLSALSWMKNYGGSGNDVATIMLQNSSTGDIFVGGYTLSSNFPTTNPRQSSLGGTESGFIQKLKSSGTTAWSSYFKSASSKTTRILCMEFNTLKNRLYFGGITSGLESPSNLSASGVYDNSYNGGTNDFFAASMDTNQTFVASTYIGGALNEVNMMGLNTDLNNDVYIFAYTNSTDFPTTAGALQSSNLGSNDKVFLKLSSGLNSLLSSTYYGGAADDYDPVGERGIKFSNCRIYTIVTSRSNNIPLTQGALTTTKSSSTSIYEPGLVVWANPPDLSNNTLTGNQEVCAGGTPTTINGSVPSYILPTLTRNGTTSSYPSLGVSITYQWQSSTDSINWTSISGATGQNLLGSQVGPLFTKTFFRRVIGGDACVIEGAADQIIVVKVIGITGTVTNASCFNANNGSIAAVAANGTAPYTYLWSNGATTATISNLAPGNYTLTVSDGASCSNTATFTITQPNAFSVACNPAGTYCVNNGGSISTSVSGGTAPFTYAWSNGATTSSISGLGAGTYSVNVTDSKGCTANCSVTLGVPVASCSKTDALCFGGNSGSASVSVSGGASPYTYLWSNGGTTASISGLAAGTYSVTVTASNGCTATCSVTVGQPASAVSAACSKTDVSCFGGNNGSVSVSASGGTSAYTYLWNTGATTASVSGRTAGSYNVIVTDANGCTASCSVTVGQPSQALSASCSKTDVLCFGGNTGSASVIAAGGSAPYSYSWSNGSTIASANGLIAGSYSVTITDARGCTSSCSVTVGQPAAALSGNVSSTVATCTQSNSSATANISGGTQPYSYLWSNGQTGSIASGYAAGSYSVAITDARGCQLSLNFTVIKTNCPPNAVDDYATTLENTPVTVTVVSNDTDVDGNIDPLTVTQISSPSNGTVVLNPNGSFTYSPNANFVGSDQFNYQVCDDGSPLPIQCDQATVFITVTGVPTTIIDSIPEDSLITICMEDFVNLQGGISSISICGMPSNGTFTISGTCVTYTPTANWNGTDEMCVISCNANNVCDTTPITIIVIPVNDPPIANDDYETTQEDVPVTVTVVTNDTDIDGNIDPSTVTVVSQPSNGSVVVNNDGTITYTPDSHYVGPDQFNYQVCDDGTPLPALCDIATVFITVTGVPTTIIDSIPEDSLITICMEDFVNLQGGISSISICGMPSNGTFTINGTCVTYTPTANWNGTDEMCVISCNANSVCDTTPITIIVIPVNDPPIANDDSTSTNEDVPVTVVVVTNDTDIDGNIDPNTVTIITPPTNGTAVVNPNGSITYTPNSHFYGQDSLVYQVCDDGTPLPALCDQATVYINVVPVNLPPVAIDDINNTLQNTPVSGNVLTNDHDPDGDNITVTANTNPSNGTVVVNADGTYTYTPNTGYTGEDTFTYTICDNGVPGPLCDVATVTIHVIPVTTENNPPVANPDNAVTLINVPVGGNVLVNDGDPDGDNIILNTTPVSNPTNGSVVLNPDGSYIYTPNNNFVGVDVFTYEICDDGVPSLCDQTTVTITVLHNPNGPDNDPPFAADDAYLTPVNTPVGGDMLDNDFDPNGDPIAVNITPVSNPAHGSVVINNDGTFTYTPNSGYIGPDQFVYEICDNGGQSGQVLCAQGTVYITVYPVIDITVVATDASCFGYSDGSVNLTVIGGVAPFTYVWSNGATTEDLSGVPAGTYSVTVTDAFGLILSGSATVGQPAEVIVSIDANGPTEFCAGGSVTLTANSTSQGTYLWSNGATTQAIVVSTSGDYSVVLTDGTGCFGTSAPVSVTVFENPVPVISADGPTEFCDGGSVVLTASEAVMYVWSPGGETTQSISVSASGSYSVWVMDANGCEGTSAPVVVTVYQNPVPVITADGPTTFCSGESVTLTSSEAEGYLWSPNGETTQSITVSTSGVYTVTVFDEFGCRGTSAPAEVVVNSNPVPQVSADGPLTFCEGGSVTLTSSEAAGNVWSPNGETTQSIVVSAAGSYFVTVTDENGCVGVSNPLEIFVNPNPVPVVTADGPLTFCAGETVVLTSSEAATYVWSPGGELTQSITVSASGDYSVWVMDANGCEGTSAPVSVVVNNNPAPVVSANGPTEFCMGGSVVLTATDAASYVWSPNGETTQSITVAEQGTYFVTVTDANGCVGISNPVAVIVNPNPVPEITADGSLTFCEGGHVALIASEAASYVWTPNGETTQTIVVSASGVYSVAVIDANGCSGVSAAVDVVVNPNPVPVISASGPLSFCTGGSVTLTSSASDMYMWMPGGETTQSISVSASGDYSVMVMDANGCEGTSAPVTVTIVAAPVPVVSIDGSTTFCEGESVTLISSSPSGNVWSPNGETTQSIVVSEAGSYYVTVTENGCVGVSAPVDVVVNPNPTPVVTSDGPTTFCQGGSVTLTSSPAASYLWSPNGETTQSITVSDPGSYYVIVFDENGCRGVSAPVAVVVNNNPTPVITSSGPTTFCLGGSVTLTASAASGYLWSNGATTQSITVSSLGNYSVTVTDANGCSGTSAPIQVDVTPSIVVTVTASGPTEICEGESVTLTATAPGASSYQWFRNGVAITGATGASITVSDFADYNVVASNQYGCEGNSQIILVKVGEVPNAYAGLDEVICPGESVTLTATGGENFLWSNGATTQSITVSPEEATDYTVSVSNPFCGQTDVDTVSVNVAELPIAAIHASDNPSLGNPVNFTDVSGDNSIVSWFWDFGDGNSAATQNTHHTYDFEDVFTVILTVENQYGCSASDTVEVEVQQIILIPNIITPNNDGFNDALGVKNNGVDDYGITIFNRWGQIVYEREAREINWDGRTNSGVELEEGTYFYILKVNNPSGSLGSWEQTGFITLLR